MKGTYGAARDLKKIEEDVFKLKSLLNFFGTTTVMPKNHHSRQL